MHDTLLDELRRRGWTPGNYRGFVRQLRGGIEWEVGVGRSARLELRWKYKDTTGEETLADAATRAAIEDAMTGIYLRVHEKPDPTRVFGNAKRGAAGTAGGAASGTPVGPAQDSLDL